MATVTKKPKKTKPTQKAIADPSRIKDVEPGRKLSFEEAANRTFVKNHELYKELAK